MKKKNPKNCCKYADVPRCHFDNQTSTELLLNDNCYTPFLIANCMCSGHWTSSVYFLDYWSNSLNLQEGLWVNLWHSPLGTGTEFQPGSKSKCFCTAGPPLNECKAIIRPYWPLEDLTHNLSDILFPHLQVLTYLSPWVIGVHIRAVHMKAICIWFFYLCTMYIMCLMTLLVINNSHHHHHHSS